MFKLLYNYHFKYNIFIKETIAFAWISFYMFDYERYLVGGKKNAYMWNITGSNHSTFHSLCQYHTTGKR